jgi:hypothetical protein
MVDIKLLMRMAENVCGDRGDQVRVSVLQRYVYYAFLQLLGGEIITRWYIPVLYVYRRSSGFHHSMG